MKTFDDVNVGDTVYYCGKRFFDYGEIIVTVKRAVGGMYWYLEFNDNKFCIVFKGGTRVVTHMPSFTVFSCKEAFVKEVEDTIRYLKSIIGKTDDEIDEEYLDQLSKEYNSGSCPNDYDYRLGFKDGYREAKEEK